jgi:catechol-2,3-dioxygenase
MEIKLLEHVNLQTDKIDILEKWYSEVLGLKSGKRPQFKSIGRWLYAGEIPVVHLVEVPACKTTSNPTLEHFAFRATGLKSLLEILSNKGIEYDPRIVPGRGILQINIRDPDGNHMHIDFTPEEVNEVGYAQIERANQ